MAYTDIHRTLALLAALAGVAGALTGCSRAAGTLGGREKCWPESDPRVPSLWRGMLAIDRAGARLTAPEGDLVLLPGALATRVSDTGGGELVRDSTVLARAGDNVTLFGGIGGDGTMIVCGIEKNS